MNIIKQSNLLENIQRLADWRAKLITQYFYRYFFASIGKGSKIIQPLRLKNVKYIEIGNGVTVNKFIFFFTYPHLNNQTKIIIGDNSVIGHFNHITAVNSVRIGKNVLTGDKVHISDNTHSYEDVTVPILKQVASSKGEVVIGDDSWIGENVSILSCKIGKHCIIGANSVVNRDVPDFSIAVGAPAKVIKQYNFDKKEWQSV